MNQIDYILLRSQLDLETLAKDIRRILNLNNQNKQEYIRDQERHGLNYGGDYVLFEIMGMEIYLLRNRGEVVLDGYEEYDYYMYITLQASFNEQNPIKDLANYIALILENEKIEVKVISE